MRKLGLIMLVMVALRCGSTPTNPGYDFKFLAGNWEGHEWQVLLDLEGKGYYDLIECSYHFSADLDDYSYTEKDQAIALYGEKGIINGIEHAYSDMGGDFVRIGLLRKSSSFPLYVNTERVILIFVWNNQTHFDCNGILFRKVKDY